MHGIIPFLLRHGYWVLFANVLAEQAGLPIPAIPVMLAMGALAGLGNFSFATALALAICAALTSDLIWFRLGRVRGHSILNLLCRISLEPDSCGKQYPNCFPQVRPAGAALCEIRSGSQHGRRSHGGAHADAAAEVPGG